MKGQLYWIWLSMLTACRVTSKYRVRSAPSSIEAAIDAVKNWKFSPATRDGKPIALEIKVEVNFHLY